MKYLCILYLSKLLTLTAFYFIVYTTHITKLTEHISVIWIFAMLIAQILNFIYATINGIQWDKTISAIFIAGISYIIYMKLTYEPLIV